MLFATASPTIRNSKSHDVANNLNRCDSCDNKTMYRHSFASSLIHCLRFSSDSAANSPGENSTSFIISKQI